MNSITTLDGEAIARKAMQTPMQKEIQERLSELRQLPQTECPLIHRFTPGMYAREIFMPKGTYVISKIHKTEHPYVVLTGRVKVWIEGEDILEIKAPHVGITKAGTRRVLEILEDCRWMTFHSTDKTTVEEVEKDVLYEPEPKEVTNGLR